jgi:hypothetical protein
MSNSVHTLGVIWKQFYADPVAWPKGAYHDDIEVLVDGVNDEDCDLGKVADDARLEIKSGYVMFENRADGIDCDLVLYFKIWLSKKTNATIAFEVPKDKLEAVKEAVLALGGKVLG